MSSEIYNAAVEQNIAKLYQALQSYCIDVWYPGTDHYSAVSRLAVEGNQVAINFLESHGAGIDYIARGAALRGDKKYCEELISRGANIDCVVRGIAYLDWRDYADELIKRGSSISQAVVGAAEGNHMIYSNQLLERGASATQAAMGAAKAGNEAYVEQLCRQGADLNHAAVFASISGNLEYIEKLLYRGASIQVIAKGAGLGSNINYIDALITTKDKRAIDQIGDGIAQAGYKSLAETLLNHGVPAHIVMHGAFAGKHITNSISSQLLYLSSFSPLWIDKLIIALEKLDEKIKIESAVKKRIVRMSRDIHDKQHPIPYRYALIKSDSQCQGLLALLMMLVIFRQKLNCEHIPFDILTHIFNFISPIKLEATEYQSLGFMVGRMYFSTQLSFYKSQTNIKGKKHIENFKKSVTMAKSQEELAELVKVEAIELAETNKLVDTTQHNKKPKKQITYTQCHNYNRIIQLWFKAFYKDNPVDGLSNRDQHMKLQQ